MSYLVLARKYRPETFSTVCGQEHVTRTLSNSIKRDKLAHAYVFSGPRGVGKTSIARILAKALNCVEGPTSEPCLQCTNCNEITQGTSLAVREIDGASHNSVDNVRELIDSFRSLPAPGSKYKVYIIDEVHMLSTAAFNALLKSLEEPPPHTIFILATTEPHKIPDTVLSRCQRHDFRALSLDVVEKQLADICDSESLAFEPEALRMIARLSDGSMRDAQTLLDRVRSFCEGDITAAETSKALGAVERKLLFELSEAIFNRAPDRVLTIANDIFATGSDPALFLSDLVTHFRELLVTKFGTKDAMRTFGISPDDEAELQAQVAALDTADVQDIVHLIRQGADNALRSGYPKYAAESLLIRAATREPVAQLASLISELQGKKTHIQRNNTSSVTRSEFKAPSAKRKVAPKKKASPITPSRTDDQPQVDQKSWNEFVSQSTKEVSPVLSELLRRLVPKKFEVGTFIAEGRAFQVKALEEGGNKARFREALNKYWPAENWNITLKVTGNGSKAEPGSMLYKEQVDTHKARAKKKEEILSHPKIQSITKAFPGSVVAAVKQGKVQNGSDN